MIAAVLIFSAMVVYWVAANYPPRPPISTRTFLDDVVPVVPAMVWIYVSPYVLSPFLMAMVPADVFRATFSRALALLPFQLGAFFMIPTYVERPAPPSGSSITESTLRHLYLADTPALCAAPSAHVSLAVIICWGLWHGFPRARTALATWCGAIVLSVLLTGQHHVMDVITALALAATVLTVFPRVFK